LHNASSELRWPGKTFARQLQRVEHAAAIPDAARFRAEPRQLGIEEADVERGVVDDQFGAIDEGQEFADDLREQRLVGEEFIGQAVYFGRTAVHFALRIEVTMEDPTAGSALDQFDAADFDDAMAARVEAGGFGVEQDLAHHWPRAFSRSRIAARACASTASFSAWPSWPRTQWNCTRCRASTVSRASHRSRFLTGSRPLVRQPLRFQPAIHCSTPCFKYCESVVRSTSHDLVSDSSARNAAVSSMRLFVVAGSAPFNHRSASR
jgi:hypothetical protein